MIKYYRTLKHIKILQTTMDAFMECNPPCKKCLVNIMCLNICGPSNYLYSSPLIQSKPCEILYEFLLHSKDFGIP